MYTFIFRGDRIFVTFVEPFNVGLITPKKESYAICPSSTGAAWTSYQLIAGPLYIDKQPDR